ncbi:hypothetical protein H4R33_001463 [Dimargaris cristalligena]|uniref:Uncharacterized protein n=1 Tax=Dimargaris cristalligena TaxID=215637 RepID=A0A4Q0A1X7_9FUNG|nr:hypothetical protein H4R33_001463 [Dimargaris cristalligena]RKP40057.1 hypothetical protein BJ085DRAFT_37835 [Dimargaris cristalligena]|eukprot:RKP40057.1 hypothetical protein BJ085DRAFT_37835 [Dimargaris cristalligena]
MNPTELVHLKAKECRQLSQFCDLSWKVRNSTLALNRELDEINLQLEVMCDVMSNWSNVFSNIRAIDNHLEVTAEPKEPMTLVMLPLKTDPAEEAVANQS